MRDVADGYARARRVEGTLVSSEGGYRAGEGEVVEQALVCQTHVARGYITNVTRVM